MNRAVIALTGTALALAACGPGKAELAGGLERAWRDRPDDMARQSGLDGAGEATGVTAGVAAAAPRAVALLDRYNGLFGGVAREVVRATPEVAERFGVPGAKAVNARLQRTMADGWSVSSLVVEAQRRSGDDVVARVRYTVTAHTEAGTTVMLNDAEQTVRFTPTGGRWEVATVAPAAD